MHVSTSRLARLIACAIGLTGAAMSGRPRPVVAVDGYHNDEPELHYRWEGTYAGGFSQVAALLRSLGAELQTLRTEFTSESIAGFDCLIVVDPDTPAESQHPKYISDREADAVLQWVKQGGFLLLLGNNAGNAEFEHLNALARRIGIRFVETTHHSASGGGKLRIRTPENSPIFAAGKEFYAVDVAPLEIDEARARVLLRDGDVAIMALAPYGRGSVFALGDPWFYNEYINSADNRSLTEALFRYILQKFR
jgi:unsaturated rhamnogalacturonyl hydrolase